MKYNIFKTALLAATGAAMLAATGCKKLEDFGDTNTNPLGATTPITAALLTNAESALGGVATGIRGSLYVQYIAETQYPDVANYQEPKLEFGGTYSGVLYDLQSIITRNSGADAGKYLASGSNANQIAVATILKSYYIWLVTDQFGDVPYSEALQGAGDVTPTFDTQEEIYTRMFSDLKAAVAGFDAGLAVQGDIIYGGDQAKWKKLANTLRMRMALRLSKVYPSAGGTAALEYASAVSDPGGIILSNADNFTIQYPGGATYKHPWYNTYDGRSDYALSKTLADILANMSDNRRNAYGSTGSPFPYGLKREQATNLPTSYAKVLADNKRQDNSPVVIISAAYSLLGVAEGIERGWASVPGYTAKSAYDAAITASFDQWGVSGATSYIASSAANYNTGTGGGTGIGVGSPYNGVPASSNAVTDNSLERIALQTYLALFPDGTQAWSEWRRTGIPEIMPSLNATNDVAGKTIPRRYVYGTLEYSLNPTEVAAAVARLQGGDVMNSRVWWDK